MGKRTPARRGGPHLVDKLPRVNETVTAFYTRCRVLAESDPALLTELRSRAKANANGEEDPNEELTPADLVAEQVANEGWGELARRYGPVLHRDHPIAVLGDMAEEFFRLALIAHLSRSKVLRAAARARPQLLRQTEAAHAAAGLAWTALFGPAGNGTGHPNDEFTDQPP